MTEKLEVLASQNFLANIDWIEVEMFTTKEFTVSLVYSLLL